MRAFLQHAKQSGIFVRELVQLFAFNTITQPPEYTRIHIPKARRNER